MWSLLLLLACAPPAPTVAPEPKGAPAPVSAPPPPVAPAARQGRPPVVKSVSIAPNPANKDSTLTASADAFDPDGDAVNLHYTWFVNDVEVLDVLFAELTPGHFRRGDAVHVKVVADDGALSAELLSGKLVIANIPPVMRTEPRELTRMDGFQMRATDADGDDLTWRVEGGPAGLSINTAGVLRYVGSQEEPGGDYVVKITAEDPAGAWARVEVPLHVSPGSAAAKKAGAAGTP